MDLRSMQASQNPTKVRCERRQNFRALSSHAHETDGGLRMRAHLGAVDDADGVDLGVPSGRTGRVSRIDLGVTPCRKDSRIISISAAFAVIDAVELLA